MKNIKACMSHITDEWKTPKNLYDHFINNDYIDLFSYQMKENQFNILYENKKLYMNPPFSQLKNIPEYIEKLINKNNEIMLLMPSRTDTIYFHKLLKYNPKIYFIKGRLNFNDSKKKAPFPTILLEFKNYKETNYQTWNY